MSNARVSGIIAAVTVAAVGVIIFLVPPLATSLTTTRESGRNPELVPAPGARAVAIEGQPAPVQATVVMAPPVQAAPTLPPPGAQQPADKDAAILHVKTALDTLFNGKNPRQVRLTAVDDRTNVDAAMDGVRERYPEASDTSEPELAEVVFTDAEHASFLFRLRYTGAPLLPTRIGTARLVDGEWRITRTTLCDVLSSAGSTCGPPSPGP